MGISDYSGRIIDERYQLVKKLAEGGQGVVYEGKHLVIGRQVAIKLLRSELLDSDNIVKRFYREAKAAAVVKHKNIVDVFDVGETSWGEPYIVMEYLEGETLAARLAPLAAGDLSVFG